MEQLNEQTTTSKRKKVDSKITLTNLTIERDKVLSQDISFYKAEVGIDWPERGGEHYRFLTYLTNKVNGALIIDAGTHQGLSCLALSQNPNNTIYTYDILPKDIPFISDKSNVVVKTMDINAEQDGTILSCPVILLDVDPHDGLQEKAFTDKLASIGYTGFLICDDIHLNTNMRQWWDSIEYPKYDITSIGHMHGTGIVCYNTTLTII
jgi:hypothetical protein